MLQFCLEFRHKRNIKEIITGLIRILKNRILKIHT